MSPDDGSHGMESPALRSRRARKVAAPAPTAGRSRGKRLGGPELTQRLNEMVTELIKENRRLKRQVAKLTERGSKVASNTLERGLRTLQRRVQRALTTPIKRRRTPAAAKTTRKKTATRKRRKA